MIICSNDLYLFNNFVCKIWYDALPFGLYMKR